MSSKVSYNFVATDDFFLSHRNISVLVSFAKKEDAKGNQDNRNLFLKLSVVQLVTRFQVYIESILKEFDYKIKKTQKKNGNLPLHFRLNSIKLEAEKYQLNIELQDPSKYDTNKFSEVTALVKLFDNWCDDNQTVHPDLKFETKFPLGATGLKELKKLFKQIDGRDIFDNAKFDIEKLNEILRRRHAIIHEDKNQQITELTVENYKKFLQRVARHIDRKLNGYII